MPRLTPVTTTALSRPWGIASRRDWPTASAKASEEEEEGVCPSAVEEGEVEAVKPCEDDGGRREGKDPPSVEEEDGEAEEEEAEVAPLESAGLLLRTDQQFHWKNDEYGSFGDFLASLSSEKRKNLRKERAKAQEGLEFRHISGADITEAHLDIFFEFYMDTGNRKWGSPYLTRASFSMLRERMANDLLFVFAYEGDTAIAGAMNLIGSETLYGRYWGCIDARPMLHFETCYYQAIDFAIARGLKTVEAGAQGGHKLARGYGPVLTHSAHWIAHPGFREAVSEYLERERAAVDADFDYLKDRTPFKKGE
jgi:predicted N-acyltransferase